MHQSLQEMKQNDQKRSETIIFNKTKIMNKFIRLNSIGEDYI